MPMATTAMGKGAVDEAHPLSLGVAGYFMGTGGMAKFMRPLIEEADLILFVGARTNQNGTDSWTLFPKGTRYVHLDIDPLEIGRSAVDLAEFQEAFPLRARCHLRCPRCCIGTERLPLWFVPPV